MATIRDVAQAAGASTATVSHVLNGSRYVSPDTKARVEDAIRALNYRRHGVARSLRSRTGTIGVMVPDIANPFCADLVLGVEDVVHRDAGGYNFILCNTAESRDKERMYFEVLQQKRVDGLILAPAGGNADTIRDMIAQGFPSSASTANSPASRPIRSWSTTARRCEPGDAPHRRRALPAALRARLDANSIDDRMSGYLDALGEAGLSPPADAVRESASNVDDACATAIDLLTAKPRVEAIFCTNNFMTLGAMRAIAEMGLRCPDDVAVAGDGPRSRQAAARSNRQAPDRRPCAVDAADSIACARIVRSRPSRLKHEVALAGKSVRIGSGSWLVPTSLRGSMSTGSNWRLG